MITALIGVNGAGKTTYLRRLHEETPGAFLPDYPLIPLELSAYELLYRLGKMRKVSEPDKRADELCTALRITGGHDCPVSTYSAGNYKKTALATLLIERPDVLYLDEPLETVDLVTSQVIIRILRRVSAAGTSVYISTQDVYFASTLDHVKVFSNLQIIAEGNPVDILGEDPLERFLDLTNTEIPDFTMGWLQ
ncbi:ATP-binding cassette domain-containing protein [Corynebacterium glucuronolyticum]|uniref:ATP-binding cassette domain-containing protein n=2 Tax=Corynebacterium glucuronolyticum TaxID=39791 RepID=A0AAX1L9F7_9CORY|nr:ATP-binding cassette domain-containing protein [Corynebacterium glucuronolyticum]EEI61812.1 ABC transporter, ATP-binding protein [Corynebacterium glucuronolyticum ATCC 51866]MCT1443471.1 ATP-binding cassette domain-containing protein [Corynebacterium glucuronolyticum]MCT1564030.1 ATP-binding cassette domain-containing protein [Corynebacterium glucuronolyticum]QQU88632.1 ATP-binding cassette domain-containing protein [Corynebacterium glucuronolyticum]QRP70494.1 ATP-binding cassette domain-co